MNYCPGGGHAIDQVCAMPCLEALEEVLVGLSAEGNIVTEDNVHRGELRQQAKYPIRVRVRVRVRVPVRVHRGTTGMVSGNQAMSFDELCCDTATLRCYDVTSPCQAGGLTSAATTGCISRTNSLHNGCMSCVACCSNAAHGSPLLALQLPLIALCMNMVSDTCS